MNIEGPNRPGPFCFYFPAMLEWLERDLNIPDNGSKQRRNPTMNKQQTVLRSMGFAYDAMQGLLKASPKILGEMRRHGMTSAKGIEFAVIPPHLIPDEVNQFRMQARKIGIELEYELIRLVGTIPPHIHRRSGGAVAKCRSSNLETEVLLDKFNTYPDVDWQKVGLGDIFFTPAGMVHGLRFSDGGRPKGPAYLLAVNTPPIEADDVVYV